MQVVAICKDFGWTYEEYRRQPTFFIELVRRKMEVDFQRAENAAKQ